LGGNQNFLCDKVSFDGIPIDSYLFKLLELGAGLITEIIQSLALTSRRYTPWRSKLPIVVEKADKLSLKSRQAKN
jgi:hypothetical protein